MREIPSLLVVICALALMMGCVPAVCSSQEETETTAVVQTTSGPVQGIVAAGIQQFLGIPYAAAPVGQLRWRAPQASTPWSQVFNATTYGPACPQPMFALGGPPLNTSEDCLFLNIFAPANATANSTLNVMFWIHGGAWVIGTGSEFPGNAFVDIGNVVYVSINYRLGALGFAALPGMEDGMLNFGFLDTQFALQWVKDNIANFGGNPNKITIFGESAGGGTVAMFLAIQSTWGLYQRVIMESGAVLLLADVDEQVNITTKVANDLGCSGGSNEAVLECMRSVNETDLVAALGPLILSSPYQYNYTFPFVDLVTLTDQPCAVLLGGDFYQDLEEIIVGVNYQEGNALVLGSVPQNFSAFTAEMFDQNVQAFFSKEKLTQTVYELYPNAVDQFGSPFQAWSQIMGDWYINAGSYLVASVVANAGIPVYKYVFTHVPINSSASFLGATHGSEVPYVFGWYFDMNPTEIPFSMQLTRYWTNFANTGNPNSPGLAEWPVWEPSTENNTIVLNFDYGTTTNFDAKWAEPWKYVLAGWNK